MEVLLRTPNVRWKGKILCFERGTVLPSDPRARHRAAPCWEAGLAFPFSLCQLVWSRKPTNGAESQALLVWEPDGEKEGDRDPEQRSSVVTVKQWQLQLGKLNAWVCRNEMSQEDWRVLEQWLSEWGPGQHQHLSGNLWEMQIIGACPTETTCTRKSVVLGTYLESPMNSQAGGLQP